VGALRRVSVLALAGLLAAAAATSVTIDFERFPGQDGMLGTSDDTFPTCGSDPSPQAVCEPLGSQFASLGLFFSSGLILQGALFPGGSATNHYVSSSPIDGIFAFPVTGISITSYSVWNATLYALDEANNVIASDTSINPTGDFFLDTLSVSTTTPIHRFTVLAGNCEIGSSCSEILNLDDLVVTFTTSTPTSTPVPATATPTVVGGGGGPGPPLGSIPTLSGTALALLALLLAATGFLAAGHLKP